MLRSMYVAAVRIQRGNVKDLHYDVLRRIRIIVAKLFDGVFKERKSIV